MKRRVLSATLAICLATACAPRERAKARRGPFLAIQQRNMGVSGSAPNPAAITLALAALPPEALSRLQRYLDERKDQALRQGLPDLFLEEDDTPPDSLNDVLAQLPALTAAANLLGSPWSAPEIAVELVSECEPNEARCLPLFAAGGALPEQGERLARRARALAWSWGNAALLRAPDNTRAALLEELRKAQLRRGGTVAAVFAGDHGKLNSVELDQLRTDARRALARLSPDAKERSWLAALAVAPAEWKLPVTLPADELLVVPRLSALARLQDFDAELKRAGAVRVGAAGIHVHTLNRATATAQIL